MHAIKLLQNVIRGRQSTNVKRMYFDTISNTNAVFLRSLLNRVNYVGSIGFFIQPKCTVAVTFLSEARFSKSPEAFRARKAIAKSRTLRLHSCFIRISLISTEVPFIQEVLGVYNSPFLDTDEPKMALRGRKVSGLSRTELLVSLPVSFTVKVQLQEYVH